MKNSYFTKKMVLPICFITFKRLKVDKVLFPFKILEKTQSKALYNLEKTKSKIFITNRLLKAQN